MTTPAKPVLGDGGKATLAALTALKQSHSKRLDGHDGQLDAHAGRMDGHDAALAEHHDRISTLENAASQDAES